jgi:DNA polymerase (family 10)
MKDVPDRPAPPPTPLTNERIAHALEDAADLLEAKDANPFRVRAFRRAAQTVLEARESIADLALNVGPAALKRLEGIGEGLAAVIDDYVRSGGDRIHYQGLGDAGPVAALTALPGIGEVLARRIIDELHIQDLEDLEAAIYEGRLEQVAGFGARRTAALRQMINSMLGGRLRRRSRELGDRYRLATPPVELLLKIDADYRRGAADGSLRKIAPRRFNPDRVAWLPILETREGGWTFRALYSNTAQAHTLGKTRDWVVIYFERAGETHQCTVVTETRGPREGQRVVRGRESETAVSG